MSNTVRLGRSNLEVNRLGFGALPLQRLCLEDAVRLLRSAVDGGVTFFDTARLYSDSETKLGKAFSGIRKNLVIATKSMGKDGAGIEADLAVSLKELRTNYLDLYQIHNPGSLPLPGDGTGRYETLAALKKSGTVRAIGLTAHALSVAKGAVECGLYDTVQYPFSLLASDEEHALVTLCRDSDVGFIAMKALAGGLIRNIPAAFAYIGRFANVLPIWGIQSSVELDQFLALAANPPVWDNSMAEQTREERQALDGAFCRGCGYCLPCPQNIAIPYIARLDRLLRRSPWRDYATPQWKEKIAAAKTCVQCGECASRCPYGLEPAGLVAANTADYEQFMRQQGVAT